MEAELMCSGVYRISANLSYHMSGDQNLPHLEKTGAFRNKAWRKQSAVFGKVS